MQLWMIATLCRTPTTSFEKMCSAVSKLHSVRLPDAWCIVWGSPQSGFTFVATQKYYNGVVAPQILRY
eukprot:Skav230594  [mRNA]  locus=scaffold3317:256438:256641:- [translate_table: standard]